MEHYDYPTGNSASSDISLLQNISHNVYMFRKKITTTTTHKKTSLLRQRVTFLILSYYLFEYLIFYDFDENNKRL